MNITLIDRNGWRKQIDGDYASSPKIILPVITETGLRQRLFIWNGNRNQLVYRERTA